LRKTTIYRRQKHLDGIKFPILRPQLAMRRSAHRVAAALTKSHSFFRRSYFDRTNTGTRSMAIV